MKEQKFIAVIDCHSLARTRFEAGYNQAEKNGLDVTSVEYLKGITSFIFKDVIDRFPGIPFDELVFVFDAEGYNVRKSIYPQYKENRSVDKKYPIATALPLEDYQNDVTLALKTEIDKLKGLGKKFSNARSLLEEFSEQQDVSDRDAESVRAYVTKIMDIDNTPLLEERAKYAQKQELFKKTVEDFKTFITSNGGFYTEAEGFEGDDLVNTFVKQNQHHKIVVYSGDRDLHQLITATTSVSSIQYAKTGDRKTVITKLADVEGESGAGILFEKMLTGDASDNLPGIKGVGPKRALEILKYGLSPDAVLLNEETPDKFKKLIQENYGLLEMFKSVIQLKELDVEIKATPTANIIQFLKK